ncbi:MAG: aminopeptidase P N-terminal domain-containing protein [Planctomycetes bacterium]|nr:aminopeptidase P N-terminal domain-containing protein [Planctomycetota bacterium]MCB9936133.1 aminopeptidase P N-terminal domain-containing protein [Planctomycetota bacterium]
MSHDFDAAIFRRRRDELIKRMQDGVAIFPAAPTYLRNGDVHHDYRQHSDFFYLTGFEEPGSLALVIKGHGEHRFVLFVPKRDKLMEIWNGRRAGPEGAKARYGADAAFTLEEIDEKVPEYLRNVQRLYVHLGDDTPFDERVLGWLNRVRAMKRQGFNAPTEMHDPSEIVHEMRLIKTADDLRYMRRACEITAAAHNAGMRATRPGIFEYQVQAAIEFEFRNLGSPRNGYGSIVAGGDNANILHYHENNMLLNDGDLLLVDAGAEFGHYSADITRTWPINGKFSEAQAEVYNWVLKAQLAAIDKCREGETFRASHDAAVEVLTEGMVAMGLLEGNPADIIAAQKQWDEDVKNKKVDPKKDKGNEPRTYREFYMHNTGHWLGMDVHDVGKYKDGDDWVPLRAGCVLTVEPGIYIAKDRDDVPEKYRGIGVRIEDDVLVTKGEPDVMTRDAVKTVEDIEALMAESLAKA